MTEGEEANEIALMLKQRRHKKNPYVGERITIDLPKGAKLLTTAECAMALNRAQQTLRLWAMRGNGPLQPVRINGRLAWRPDDVERLLNGEA